MQKKLLDYLTGAAAAAPPSQLWLSLATGVPNAAGASDGPYSVAGVGGRATFTVVAAISPDGYISNRQAATFRATAIATALGWNLWDAGAGGNRLAYGTLAAANGVASGGTHAFARSAFSI